MTAPDPFALGGRQDDAELVELEHQLRDVLSRWNDDGMYDMSDDDADVLCHQQHGLEERINETAPRTATGAAVKLRHLRHLLRLLEEDIEWRDDETVSVRQLLTFMEAAGGAA
jgi:hypothetical protein